MAGGAQIGSFARAGGSLPFPQPSRIWTTGVQYWSEAKEE